MGPNRTFMAMCVALAAALWVPPAVAQARGDPADPGASVPAAAYRSPFASYRALGDEAVGDWRAANDEVGRIGGWRAYAREAQAPDEPATPTPGASPTVPQSAPAHQGVHGSHPMPGRKP